MKYAIVLKTDNVDAYTVTSVHKNVWSAIKNKAPKAYIIAREDGVKKGDTLTLKASNQPTNQERI